MKQTCHNIQRFLSATLVICAWTKVIEDKKIAKCFSGKLVHWHEVSSKYHKNIFKTLLERDTTLLLKLYSPFLWTGWPASRLEPLRGGSSLFTTKFPESPGSPWSHPVVLNTELLDWESSSPLFMQLLLL